MPQSGVGSMTEGLGFDMLVIFVLAGRALYLYWVTIVGNCVYYWFDGFSALLM